MMRLRSLSRQSFARASKKVGSALRGRTSVRPASFARRALCTAMAGGSAGAGILGNPTWQQTMLRVKDGQTSVKHYQDVYGMTLLDKLDFPDMNFSLYFLATVKDGEKTPEPGTDEAHRYLWNYPGVTLELTHNWGTEAKEGDVYHPGNQEKDGFGHIAFACDDVYASSERLSSQGVDFKKKPDEGRMKGLAFAYDPDNYWVEIVRREPMNSTSFNLAQTMLRVKDPQKSLKFYIDHMGMTLVREKHFEEAKFSLYFLATIPAGSTEPDPTQPVLELTHNHGTEDDESFNHFTGNEDGRKGFGHVGFLVDDVYAKCKELQDAGFQMKKGPDDGTMKGLAFALDPDGYWIEIIKRGGYDAEATPYTLG
uniref:Lactoylglutathione lyase n=1 Tax=Lotharella oceanica TaxID=641309 RepID=A0A7S2X8H4_9EUKA|mmetsp:Transcript_1778/g.3364  ORF Transcript_1778/g.3364 Transcript_1778/m.3364 type:complete len:367 (+) Transcript_1778:23-1123(+)